MLLSYLVDILGISDFVGDSSKRRSLMEGNSTLNVGLGWHSKDFATLIVHLGFALSTCRLPYDPKNLGGLKMDPIKVILHAIFALVTCYVDLRREL